MGLLTTTWSTSMMIGPPLGTFVFERNPAALWAGCGALALISGRTLPSIDRLFSPLKLPAAGQHGFDVLDDVDRSREIIARTLGFIRTHCGAAAKAAADAPKAT